MKVPTKRVLWRLGEGAGVLVALIALVAVFQWKFHRGPPNPGFSPARSEVEARQQDIAYVGRLPERDHSFTPKTLAEFRRIVDDLAARAATLTPAELEMAIARAVAAANNGHTNVL